MHGPALQHRKVSRKVSSRTQSTDPPKIPDWLECRGIPAPADRAYADRQGAVNELDTADTCAGRGHRIHGVDGYFTTLRCQQSATSDAFPGIATLKGAAVVRIEPLALGVDNASLAGRSCRGTRDCRSGDCRRRRLRRCRFFVYTFSIASAKEFGKPHKPSRKKIRSSANLFFVSPSLHAAPQHLRHGIAKL